MISYTRLWQGAYHFHCILHCTDLVACYKGLPAHIQSICQLALATVTASDISSPPQPPSALSWAQLNASWRVSISRLISSALCILICCIAEGEKRTLEKNHSAKSYLIAICYIVSVSTVAELNC